MKKFISIINIALSLFVLSSCNDELLDYENVLFEGELSFALVGENKYSIIEYKGNDLFLDLPDTYKGIPITKIDNDVFENLLLTGVEIGKYVETIGHGAFSGNRLTNLTIPNSVTKIENYTFSNNQLTSVQLSNSLTTIGEGAFFRNKLTNLTIPDSVTEIDTYAFKENQLTSIKLSNSLTEIGFEVFDNNLLTSVTIPNSVIKIREGAFTNNLLTIVTIPDSVSTIEPNAFDLGLELNLAINSHFKTENGLLLSSDGTILLAALETMTSLTIPNSVTTIGNYAFYNNNLTSVTIPESVTAIGFFAFSLNNLSSVKIMGNENRFNSIWNSIGFPLDLKPQS